MSGLYRTIVADPPWPIRWSNGGAWRTNGRGERHRNKRFRVPLDYPTMPVQDICDLPVRELAESNAVLWLWVTDRFALEGAGAAVARAWGFEPLRFLVWEKHELGMGNCPRGSHELCLVCTRGRSLFTRRDVRSVQRWKGRKQHSAKPDGFFDLIVDCSPGPYLELFARRQRLGWDSWGDEALCHVEMPA